MTQIDPFTFVILALAAFRITRLITTDTIFDPIREKIWNKYPPNRINIGYLITCDWCTSIWVAPIVIFSYLLVPSVVFVVSLVLATSAVVGFLAARS
jgi:hypothetical protein